MKAIFFSLLIPFLLAGCSSTRITASWQDPETDPVKFSKIAVIAISSSNIYRLTFENDMVEALDSDKKTGFSSMQMDPPMPAPTEDNRDRIKDYFSERDYDAIITISLLDEREDTQYVPGESYVVPRTYYNRFGRYYYTTYHRVYTPGYYNETTSIFLETNLYSVENGKLLWSAQTETVDPSSIEEFSNDYAETIALKLREDGYLNTVEPIL